MRHKKKKRLNQIEVYAEELTVNMATTEIMFLRRLAMANITAFDFQVPIGFYIVDFVFPVKMLIVELDGPSHIGREERDEKRDRFLTKAGFTVWRITNAEAAKWPLVRIRNFERPLVGRPYAEALLWASDQYDMAQRQNVPKFLRNQLKNERFIKNTLWLQASAARQRKKRTG